MVNFKNIKFCATAIVAVSVTGCASSSVNKTVQAAPITYKVGDGPAQYASLATPRSPVSQPVRDTYRPEPYRPEAYRPPARPQPVPAPRVQVPAPAPAPAPQQFNQATVDQDLYQHQRLGNTYTVQGQSYTPEHQPTYDVTGTASRFDDKFDGKPTATGEVYDINDFTAAHKTLPMNSLLFITNLENGKTTMVRLNDRGPFDGNGVVSLSKASAEALGITSSANVRVQYAGPADPMYGNHAPVRPTEEYVEAEPAPRYTPAPVPSPYQEAPALPRSAPTPAPFVPAAPVAPSAPEALGEGTAPDGQVTLTIKGPIHVAKSEGQSHHFVRERFETK